MSIEDVVIVSVLCSWLAGKQIRPWSLSVDEGRTKCDAVLSLMKLLSLLALTVCGCDRSEEGWSVALAQPLVVALETAREDPDRAVTVPGNEGELWLVSDPGTSDAWLAANTTLTTEERKDVLEALVYRETTLVFLIRDGRVAGVDQLWGPFLVRNGAITLRPGQSLELTRATNDLVIESK